MKQTDMSTTTRMINALLDTDATGEFSLMFSAAWRVRVNKGLAQMEITMTHGWLHEDNRWHRCSKTARFDLTDGTGNLMFQWVHRNADRLANSHR